MICEKCGGELPNNSLHCPYCGAASPKDRSSKKGKTAIIIAVCAVLAVALVLGTVMFIFGSEESAIERLANASLKTFSSSCRIKGTDIKLSTSVDTDVEIIIPGALTDGRFAATVDKITYYRNDGFEYYGYDSNAGVFRRVAPDADELENELSIGRYLDYIGLIAEGDYKALAEFINSDTFAEDVLHIQKFAKRTSEVIDNYFSDEYMTENYGFVYTENANGGIYSFSLSVNKALDTVYEITEGSKDCFVDEEEYHESLKKLDSLREKLKSKGDEMLFALKVTVADGVIAEISVELARTEDKNEIAMTLEFSDYGTASVSEKLVKEYDERKAQLGDKDYLAWYGPIVYSDYYNKD